MASARSSDLAAGPFSALFSLGATGGLTDGQLLERFLTRDDPAAAEAAFTALVDRHGAMVLSVCRRELGDLHEAHDAFQATFLVLVSKARSIRRRENVGGWLFGIARRVAARTRVDGARRRRHLERWGAERNLLEVGPAASTSVEPELDYAPLLAEVDLLPERFRAPVVLHYFEGLSAEATAQRLGCARGTVLSRLSRARDRLRRRLEQRGIVPAMLVAARDTLGRWLPFESVPASLAHDTIGAASSLGLAGAAIESVVPATVARLSRRVARTLAISRVGAAASLIIAAAGVSIAVAATLSAPVQAPQRGAAMEKPQATSREGPAPRSGPPSSTEPIAVTGQVVDPDGKPVANAELVLSVASEGGGGEPRRLGATGPDGRFDLSVPLAALDTPTSQPVPLFQAAIAAFSPGFGPDWASIDRRKANPPIKLTLRRDDVPVEGRVISLEGRPVPGLSVKVGFVGEIPPALMSKLRENAGRMNPGLWGDMRNIIIPGEKGAIRPIQTGADGRFRLTGIGRDRVAVLLIEGASIELSFAMVATAADRGYRPVLVPADGSGERKIEGPRFEISVAPGRTIEGIVRDRDTGRPIAGARVQSWYEGGGPVTTDGHGRFRLENQPRNRENFLTITVTDQPYIKVVKPFKATGSAATAAVEIAMKRGVWVEGQVTGGPDGEPAKAVVTYYPFRDNPNLGDCPDASFLNNHISDEAEYPTDASGNFRATALTGGGILAVRAAEPRYLTAIPLDEKTAGNVVHPANFLYQMHAFQALSKIDVPDEHSHIFARIGLVPGRPQHIRIVDPDGRPIRGARLLCLQTLALMGNTIDGDEVTYVNANHGKAQTLIIWTSDGSLGGTIDLKGDEPDPIRLVIRPTGAVTGRLIDEDGKPKSHIGIAFHQRLLSRGVPNGIDRSDSVGTDAQGRFHIKNLVPGLTYSLRVINRGEEMNASLRSQGYIHQNRWTVKPGETLEWGDVQVKLDRP